MKIRLLSSALDDLSEGRLFYEKQGEGLGDYFFDSLFSDIVKGSHDLYKRQSIDEIFQRAKSNWGEFRG
ncbi:MAG: hypothetical protein ACOYOS_21755 [Syntrophales bacterium]